MLLDACANFALSEARALAILAEVLAADRERKSPASAGLFCP
jgi:hypothetical protein